MWLPRHCSPRRGSLPKWRLTQTQSLRPPIARTCGRPSSSRPAAHPRACLCLTAASARGPSDANMWVEATRHQRFFRLRGPPVLARDERPQKEGSFWRGAAFRSVATEAATASSCRSERPTRTTALQRLLSVALARCIHGLGHIAVIQAPATSRNQWPVSRYCRHCRSPQSSDARSKPVRSRSTQSGAEDLIQCLLPRAPNSPCRPLADIDA